MKIYLDRNYIAKLATNGEVFRLGSDYYSQGRVGQVQYFESGNMAYAPVQGESGKHDVTISFDGGGMLKSYKCNCRNSIWRGACKHVIAVLLALYDEGVTAVKRQQSLRMTDKFLKELEREAFYGYDDAAGGSRGGVRIEPSIEIRDGRIYLAFSLGRKRLYKLRNIGQFCDAVANGRTVSYGKQLEFEHSPYVFETVSAGLARLMAKEQRVHAAQNRYSYGYSSYSSYYSNEKYLMLSPAGLDSFFDLMTRRAELEGESDFRFIAGESGISFIAHEAKDGISLSAPNTLPPLAIGYSHSYLLEDNALRRLSKGTAELLEKIYGLFSGSAEKELVFSEKNRARFMNLLYPSLRDYDLLSADSTVNESDNSAFSGRLEKKLYLDASSSELTAKVLFCYGDTEINPLTEVREGTDGSNDSEDGKQQRNVYEEYRLLQELKRLGFVPDEKRRMFVMHSEDDIYEFISPDGSMAALQSDCELYVSEGFKNISAKPRVTASFGVRLAGGMLEFDINTSGMDREELAEIVYSLSVKKRYYRLKNGSFLNLSNDKELSEAADLIEGLNLSKKEIIAGEAVLPKYRALAIDQAAASEALRLKADSVVSDISRDIKEPPAPVAPPESLRDILREYQKEGFTWLSTLARYGFGGILADDMGLGKTIQVIALILSAKAEGGTSLVVAPTSLIYNWEKEFSRFAPELSVTVISGTAEKRRKILQSEQKPDVYITTYDTLKRDTESYENLNFRFIIADEAQAIKNPLSLNAQAVKQLKGEQRFALTGTPVQNAISELWSIFDFIMPGYLYGPAEFGKRYEQPIIKEGDKDKLTDLRRQISPFILRRVKQDVLKELPDKIETTIYADMTEEQNRLYTAHLAQAKGELDKIAHTDGFATHQIEILAQLTRLRQICCHPATFVENYSGGSGKLNAAIETVSDAIDAKHRILIFSQFTTMLGILRDELRKNSISYFYLDGATDSKQRLEMCDRFNSGEKKVFLISLKAGGTGLNLTGADVVIHYDPWWNPAVMDQATDRAHRFGQQKAVQVINIVAKGSIEEKIMKLQSMKKELIDSVIHEGAQLITKMSSDDILELFRD